MKYRGLKSRFTICMAIWLAVDFTAGAVGFVAATMLRFAGDFSLAVSSVGAIGPRDFAFAGCVIIGQFMTGMYRSRHRTSMPDIVTRSCVAALIAGGLSILAYYALPGLDTGRGVLALAIVATAILLSIGRRVSAPLVDSLGTRRRVVVIGAGHAARKIARRRRRSDHRRYQILGYVRVPGDSPPPEGSGVGPIIGSLDDLKGLDYEEVVLALDDRRGAIDVKKILDLKMNGTAVLSIVDFLERETGQIDLDVVDPAWFIFTDGCHSRMRYLAAKRAMDLGMGLTLLMLFAPVFLLISIALLVESRGRHAVLYRQQRVGLHGRRFELLKFRSMRPDAESGGARWSSDDDDRVTRVGRVIRRMRLDELPQLLNVVRGEMSIVGARPERPEFVQQLVQEIPMYEYRHCVKPGLAGWAQLSFPYGSSTSDAREKLKYDLYYIKNASCFLDIFILAQTFEIVLWGRGASMEGRRQDEPLTLPCAQLPTWHPDYRKSP